MNFEVYCDESRPDLLASRKPNAKFMVIGSLWLASDDRDEFKRGIHELRNRHKMGREFKWQKVSRSRRPFYDELVDWFCSLGDRLRFRCIAVRHSQVNLMHYHEGDQELGFYKFYYQMLHHWILDFNEYAVFCDWKSNRDPRRLDALKRCLRVANLSANVINVQATRSDESVFLQLVDVLTGAAAARLNRSLKDGGAKASIATHLEQRLGRTIGHTVKSEQKFNVFVIDLGGGW